MAIALNIVPVSACEVGEGDSGAVVVHRQRAELRQAAPLRHVVDIHIQGQAILQAVDKAGIHDVVHAAMTHLTTQLAKLLNQGVAVGLHKHLALLRRYEAMGIEVIHLWRTRTLKTLGREGKLGRWVLRSVTLCARELKETVVGLWRHHIVLNFNNLALRSAHKCRRVVAIAKLLALLARAALDKLLTHEALRIHRYQCREAVAAMYVHALRNRAEAMRCVEVTAVLHVVLKAPV